MQQLDALIDITSMKAYRSDNNWIVARVRDEREVLASKPDFEAIRRENLAVLEQFNFEMVYKFAGLLP